MLVLKEMDGECDVVKRNYFLVMQSDILMAPEYPKGYLNPGWLHPPRKESNKRFEKEVDY